MKRGLIIAACVVGVAVTSFAILDPNFTLASVGLSFTISSALILYVNESLNKRIDDLREDIGGIRDDIRGINQNLQNLKHH